MGHRYATGSRLPSARRRVMIAPPVTLEDALSLLEQGRVSATELVEYSLNRIHQKDIHFHSFITVTKDEALEYADLIDQQRRNGENLGMLAGIPIAHKDVFFTKDIRTTAGSKAFSEFKPDVDAIAVQILQESGAISLGKTNCHEFSFGSPSPEDFFPAARNPWNPEYMPGSSSSGSATAVGLGYCFAATGSDTGGSIRHPAAASGLVGMKPTRNLISSQGLIPLAPSLDTVGVLTRNVRDNLIVLCAMTGAHAYQPFVDGLQPQLMNLKIGVDIDHWQDTSVSIEVRTTFIEALEVLKTLGALITPIHLPELQNITEVASNIINFEAYQQLDLFYTHQRELMGAGLIQKLNSACKVVKEDYAQAQRQSEAFTQDLIHLFDSSNLERVDVIVSIGREAPAETMASLLTNPLGARSSCNRLYSLTGHPALTIPMGFASNGMPLAIQFAGHFHDEYLLYQVAHAFEAKIQCFKDRTDVPWMSV